MIFVRGTLDITYPLYIALCSNKHHINWCSNSVVRNIFNLKKDNILFMHMDFYRITDTIYTYVPFQII